VGYVQYATGLPVPLVSLHMLGACLLTATLTWGLWSVLPTRQAAISENDAQVPIAVVAHR
ncbi:MAG: hypothetical protein WA880_03220, partial [Ornithinimicrobium sp.]